MQAGEHEFHYLVDGERRTSPDVPVVRNEQGQVNNQVSHRWGRKLRSFAMTQQRLSCLPGMMSHLPSCTVSASGWLLRGGPASPVYLDSCNRAFSSDFQGISLDSKHLQILKPCMLAITHRVAASAP